MPESLPWMARDCTRIYPLTLEAPQIDASVRRSGFNAFELAAVCNHDATWEQVTPVEALFGDVVVNTMHRDVANFVRAWNQGRAVYPVTFLLEEF